MSFFAILFLIILTVWYYSDKSYKLDEDEEQKERDQKRKVEFYRGNHNRHQQNKKSKATTK